MTGTAIAPMFQGSISARALAFIQQNNAVADELGAGITGGFAVLGIKGKVWHIKHRGEDTPIMASQQPGMPPSPVPHVAVVIIAASSKLTKTWYEAGYKEGSTEAPDCYSMNGEIPDNASKKKQNATCSGCRWNQFGSAQSADGKARGKACSDSKRLAVVPVDDMHNEINGGPMMLRVPAASLAPLQEYAGKLKTNDAVYFAVSTWLYFDQNEAYPRIMFAVHRPLSDDEFDYAMELRDDAKVARIIESTEALIPDAGQQAASDQQPVPEVQQTAPAPVPAPQPQPAPVAPAPEVPPAPVETEEEKQRREFAEWQASKAAAAAPVPANQNPAPAPQPAPAPAPVAAAPTPAPQPAPAPAPTRAPQSAPPVPQAAPTQAAAPAPVQTTQPQAAPADGAPVGLPAGGNFTEFLGTLMN